MSLIKSYIVTFIVFIILELFWLIILARDLYANELGYIMKSELNVRGGVKLTFYEAFNDFKEKKVENVRYRLQYFIRGGIVNP